jgi:MFS family permease
VTGFVLFGSGVALLSYVLEVFGEHSLSAREVAGLMGISLVLIGAYGRYAMTADRPLPRLDLLRVRTLRVAVTGSFVTRLGVGGMPFLLPLLYQVGLGYTPVESGLLIMPQSIAAIVLKVIVPKVLTRVGYRWVLLLNTTALGATIVLFATVGPETPVWLIVGQAFLFGFLSSLQYTSMSTLAYADVAPSDASMASTIASTLQQMSMSFGVATASLAAAAFLPDRFTSSAPEMIRGVHEAFALLGVLTVLSTAVFVALERDDGESMSRHS